MKKLTILSLILLIGLSGFSQELTARLDSAITASISNDGPGVTVLIRHNGEILYKKGFGMANIEQDVKMDPGHVFRIGSITKQFTACAVLKLQEEGKLNIQDDMHKYLPDYPTQDQKITIEHLLTHTSGIKSYTSLPEWTPALWRTDYEPLELIEFFKRDSLDFMPGEEFSYNNSAYFILGYIIEKASGMTYEDYIEKNFFEPLGMKNSYYDHTDQIIPMRVSGYEKEEGNLINAPYLSMTQPYAAGSLMSTVDDLDTWYKAVFAGKVVKPESLKKAHTSYVLKNGKETGYGYGWFIGNRYEKPTIEHGGGINGSLTKDLYFPEDDLFVAVFSNCTCLPPDPLAASLAALVLNIDTSKKEISLSEEQLKKFVGEYELMPGFILTVTLEEGQLMVQPTGQSKNPIFAESENKFFLKIVEAQLEFILDGDKVSSVILYQGPAKLEGKRIK